MDKTIIDILRRLIVTLVGISTAMVIPILVLIYGWGLEPKSWAWIIVVGIFGQCIAVAFIEIGKAPKKK